MKSKKIFLLFAAFIFAAVAIYNIHLAQSNQNSDVSLADIAIMAQADGEATIECHQFAEPGRCNQCYEFNTSYPNNCKWTGKTLEWCCI